MLINIILLLFSFGLDQQCRKYGQIRMKCLMLKCLFLLSATVLTVSCQYVVPPAKVEALKPKGFRVSIPDEAGIQLFAFHGNLNKPMAQTLEGGTFSKDVLKAKNSRWSYENANTKLKAGDKIYYWLYVQKDEIGYRLDDQIWTYTGDDSGAAPCLPTQTTMNGKASCAGKLLFNEEFNTLDSTRWHYDVRIPHSPDWEFVTHMNIEESVRIEDGNLIIRPTLLDEIFTEPYFVTKGKLELTACTGKAGTEECVKQATGGRDILPPVITTRIRSKDAFSFRYGKVEMRAKVPTGDWLFPELWLSPKEKSYGSDYESGQIRVAFTRGNEVLNARAGAHIGNKLLEAGCMLGMARPGKQPVVKRYLTSLVGSEPWSNLFRNYTVIWTPDELIFSVDNQVYATVTPPAGGFKNFPEFSGINRNPWEAGTKMAPFDREFYVRIGLGVGGIRAFPDNSSSNGRQKPWKNSDPKAMALFWRDKNNWYPSWANSQLLVDHIKIWAL